MNDNIINLNEAKERRAIAESDADEAQWNNLVDQVTNVLMQSDMQNGSLISATLCALLDTLERSGLTREEAKLEVTGRLKMFRTRQNT